MIWAEVSALTGDGIQALFDKIAEKVYEIESDSPKEDFF
jgi:GTPase SAR1 family protein